MGRTGQDAHSLVVSMFDALLFVQLNQYFWIRVDASLYVSCTPTPC